MLVGIDGSDTSLRAAAYAIGLASRQQCALTAVYVSDCYAGLAAGALIAAGEQTAENLRGLVSDAIARTGIQGDFICRGVTGPACGCGPWPARWPRPSPRPARRWPGRDRGAGCGAGRRR
jgi:hypothetical protein